MLHACIRKFTVIAIYCKFKLQIWYSTQCALLKVAKARGVKVAIGCFLNSKM